MLNFDARLRELLAQYGLQQAELILNEAEAALMAHWRKMSTDTRVAIWGAGDHTTQVLLELVSLKSKNVVCIIDKNIALQGKMIQGIPVVAPPAVVGYRVETIVVSSFAFRNEISAEITAQYPQCQVVDLYAGVNGSYRPFYDHNYYVFYKELFDLRTSLKTAADPRRRQAVLQELIVKYLHIRDFVSAKLYLDSYLAAGYPEAGALKEFCRELDLLLNDLQVTIKQRTNRDVGVLILDSLRGQDVFGEDCAQLMPFFSGLMQRSVVFSNAFSTSTYTAASFKSFLTGKMVIDDDLLQNRTIELNESPLLRALQQEGYLLRQYGGIRIHAEQSLDQAALVATGMNNRERFEAISKRLWDYLCDLAAGDQRPTFALLHLMESHWPFPSGLQEEYIYFDDHPGVNCYKWKKEQKIPLASLRAIKNDALHYIDRQLQFFAAYLPPDLTLIIMGDHGQALGEQEAYWSVFTWYDPVIHVPLVIADRKLTPRLITDLVSLQDFPTLIRRLVEAEEVVVPSRDFVEIQRDPIFDRKFYADPEFVAELGEKFIRGYKVVRTQTDKYVLYDDGTEEYLILPDETQNLISQPEYAKRVSLLRSFLKKRS